MDKILRVLDSTADADKAIGNANLEAVLSEHICVGHNARASDDGLSGTKVLTERPWAHNGVHELTASLSSAANLEPEHTTVVAVSVLLISNLLLGMGVEAGVANLLNLRVLLKELGDDESGVRLALDAEGHGLHGLELVEGHLWAHVVSEDVLGEAELIGEFLGGRHKGTTNGHIVAIHELGGGDKYHIGAEIDGAADVCGSKGVIANVDDTVGLADLGKGLEVGKGAGGVGGGLREDKLGVGLDSSLDLGEILVIHTDEGELHTHTVEENTAGAVGTPIAAVGDDSMVALAHEGADSGGGGSHTSGINGGAGAVLKGGELLLKSADGGVGGAGVRVAFGAVLIDGLLNKGGGLVDGSEDGTGDRVRADTSVNGKGLEGIGLVVPRAGAVLELSLEVLGGLLLGGHDNVS